MSDVIKAIEQEFALGKENVFLNRETWLKLQDIINKLKTENERLKWSVRVHD